ncbi:MAG: Type 1 glutamine amidotransferase-like domain-containing protein [Leucobacter sp.]
MNLLLLSINLGAVPDFLNQSLGELSRPLRLGYISDASEGMPFAAQERAEVEALGHDVIEIRARETDPETFADLLNSVDAVYAAGGETFVLLEALRLRGVGDILAERVRAGLPYIGCSAGSIIAGPSITPAELMDDRAAAPALQSDDGLGLIEQVIIPHADGQLPPYPPELIAQIVATYADRYPLLTLHDDQAFRVTAEGSEIVASR